MTRAEETLAAAAERAAAPPFGGEARCAALGRFVALGLPTARMEEWRHTSLSALAPVSFAPADPTAPLTPAAVERLAGRAEGPRLVFVNGRYREALSSPGRLPAGAWAGSLAAAPAERADLVGAHLGRLAAFESHALAALNTASAEDGAFVHLPEGTAAAEPIELLFVTVAGEGPAASHPRVLVVAGPGSEASLVESYVGAAGGPTFTNAVTEAVLGEGARLEHYRLQDEAAGAWHFGLLASEQGKDSRFSTHASSFGAALSRSEVKAVLAGEGGEARVNGLYMAAGSQVVDNHSVIEHARPRCQSRETFKGILDGAARGVFGGRIRVMPDAQKSDAYQLNSNLLLSDDAQVDTKPQLEIFADDVKCGHGGTVGQLDEDALFYLRSRGIDLESARSLLIYAFASEMVGLVRPPGLRDRIARLVAARLPNGEKLREVA